MSPVIALILRHLLLAGVGAGAVAVLGLCLRQLVRRDAVLRYRVMVTALIAGAAMLPLQLLIAEASVPTRGVAIGEVATSGQNIDSERRTGTRTVAMAPSSRPEVSAPVGVTGTERAGLDDAAAAVIAVYFAVVAVMLGLHARGALGAWRLLKLARPVGDARVLRVWGGVVSGLRRPALLLECEGLHAPACRLMGGAAVIVPVRAGSLDDETLTVSLRHEIVHLNRRDGLVATFAGLARAALWFQPLVWVFVRQLGIDREQSCDAIVVRSTGRPHAYALALLRFCDTRGFTTRPAMLIGFESAHTVRRRIMMLSHAMQPASRVRRMWLLAASAGGFAITSVAHGLFTAAAEPGSLMPAKSAAGRDAEAPRRESGPRATTEVRAPVDGRSDAWVYKRVMSLQSSREHAQAPGGLVQKFQDVNDASSFFFAVNATPAKVYPRGTWVTDEEVILSTSESHVDGDSIRAQAVRLRLPGGSKLRAVF